MKCFALGRTHLGVFLGRGGGEGNQRKKSLNSPGRPDAGPCREVTLARWLHKVLLEIGLEVMGMDKASPHSHSVLLTGPKLFPEMSFQLLVQISMILDCSWVENSVTSPSSGNP